MAIAPKILSASPVSSVNRMAGLGSVAKPYSKPVDEVDEYSPLSNYGVAFYYEKFLAEQDNTGNGREHQINSHQRSINTALIRGTTQSFAAAFENTLFAVNADGSNVPSVSPKTSVIRGIGIYEAISRVIRHQTPPRGESMNFSV